MLINLMNFNTGESRYCAYEAVARQGIVHVR